MNQSTPRPPGSVNPKRQPCRTCRYYRPDGFPRQSGYCEDIEDNVKAWWTGCIRHSPPDKETK